MKHPVVGYAGLTHLGLNSAAASASKGFSVVGYHNDSYLIDQLKQGKIHLTEPDLEELIAENMSRLQFSSDHKSLSSCDIVYISVDVPTDDQGVSDLAAIYEMINIVSSVLIENALLVILCQVPPGFTRTLQWPSYQLFYQVETLIFGRAIERACFPERFILGCSDPKKSVDERLLTFLNSFNCQILPMLYESAELAKISINMFLIASVSASNTLAEVCESIGADWNEIVPALRLDKRIGNYAYLSPGLGYRIIGTSSDG
jgi:UDPglucose 6-dehydrogenase